ncbi:DIS3-like exonuclease 1 isoform X2 [Pocillopora damicornis]|uniref:DIS3-like exonuclease 1 isoform X2 n=1 Tax=Pocillopora damicornis TaxID=46731 RepID=UPI000F550363|nr:DIS3-like exonuclease 1 isoform X2 [Pocillopora damicornis]
MIKTNKPLRLKTKTGRPLDVVREHYLQKDVPCHSEVCAVCEQGNGTLLCKSLTHYVVPDCQVSRLFLEIFESEEIQGVIFFETVVNHVQHQGGRKLQSQLKDIVKDNRQQSIIFSNEFCDGAYVAREPRESLEEWQWRCIYTGAVWYYNHLNQAMPLVILTEDQQIVEKYGNKSAGVFIMRTEDYLTDFYPTCQSILELYYSLAAVNNEANESVSEASTKEYQEYLPAEVLEAGIKAGRFLQGCLNVNKHCAQDEAFVQKSGKGMSDSKDSLDSDVLITGMVNRNRAVHGDVVVVELFPKSQWKGRSMAIRSSDEGADESREDQSDVMPTGRVVGVVQRNWRDYVASFAENEETQGLRKQAGKVVVVPWDYRIPKIRISTRQVDSLRDHRIVVRIDLWEVNSMYPSGHFVRSLGPIGDLETEVQALMVEHTLAAPSFTEAQLKELPTNTTESPWVMSEAEIAKRRDLRKSHLIFSIDPKGCEDVDDTLSVRTLKRGQIELGVHIADVSHFVRPGSLTDAEAKSRSTTVYLADRRFDMLPEVLSADLCSLIGGVDRYAVSVMWVLDSEFNVLKTWFGRTVIRSSYKLFYEAAQAIADGETSDEELIKDIPELQEVDRTEASKRLSEIRKTVTKLMDIARVIKTRRTIHGALELEGVEVQVQLGDNKDIKDLIPKKPLEIHETVAECMIFANHWVAKKIAEAFPSAALLRHHPLPRKQHFSNLIHCAASKGFSIDTSSNKSLADSLDECVDPQDPNFNKLVRSLATQAMSNALYFSTGSLSPEHFFHYGLALDHYTHFTSPIRRYADVIVHRLLMAAVENDNNNQLPSNKELQETCHHINIKHRAAQNAQKESVDLFQCLFFQDLSEDDERRNCDAVIFSLRANGFLVLVPRYGLKGPVYLKDKTGQVVTSHISEESVYFGPGSLSCHEFHITVKNAVGSFDFRLFDHVQVRISVAEARAHAQSLKLDLLSMETRQSPPPGEMESQDEDSHKMKRSELIKEVKSSRNDQDKVVGTRQGLDSDFAKLKSEFGQTHESVSLYCLMEFFREMSLRDDDV